MSKTHTVERQIVVNRSPFEVLNAFMKTSETAAWWNGCQTFCQPKKSGILSWQWRNAAGHFLYITHGTIQQYEPGLFLDIENIWQYNFAGSELLGPLHLLIECTPQAGSTLLIIRHSGFTDANEQWMQYCQDVENGWNTVLPQLKVHLEKRTTDG